MGLYLAKPDLTPIKDSGYTNELRYAVSSIQGWRNTNEDRWVVRKSIAPGVSYFAIFDGHGGSEIAQYCEFLFSKKLKKNENFKKRRFSESLYETFIDIDESLNTIEGRLKLKEFMDFSIGSISFSGSAAIVILIADGIIHCANIGTSQAFVYTTDHELIYLNETHKAVDVKEQDRIFKAGGFIQNGRINGKLSLSRTIGDFEYKNNSLLCLEEQMVIPIPSIRSLKIQSNYKLILIGSDGLFELNSPAKLCCYANKKSREIDVDLNFVLHDMIIKGIALDTTKALGCDNITGILITLTSSSKKSKPMENDSDDDPEIEPLGL